MILENDERIKSNVKDTHGLFMCVLYILNQYTGLKVSPAKIDIYFTEVLSKYESCSIENILKYFGISALVKYEGASYKLKKNEKAIIKYEEESLEGIQCVVGVGNVVCYNPLGNVLKGKATESYVIKFK